MKKLLSLALALALTAAMAVTAFADNTTTLTTTVPAATYTLHIPADQEIPFGALKTDIGSVTVTDSSGFASGKDLKVTLTYGAFTCENTNTDIPFSITLQASEYSGSNDLSSTIKSGDTFSFSGNIFGGVSEYSYLRTAPGGAGKVYNADKTVVTIRSDDWGKALAGDYSATITFTAEVVSA